MRYSIRQMKTSEYPLLAEFLVVAIAVPFALAVIMTALSQFAGIY